LRKLKKKHFYLILKTIVEFDKVMITNRRRNMKKNKILLLVALLIVTGLFTTACDNKEKNGNDGYDYLVLVNKYSQLPDDWEKNV
jgi:hypothetical protein